MKIKAIFAQIVEKYARSWRVPNGHGTRGNFEKSGVRFSMKAFFPSLASSLM